MKYRFDCPEYNKPCTVASLPLGAYFVLKDDVASFLAEGKRYLIVFRRFWKEDPIASDNCLIMQIDNGHGFTMRGDVLVVQVYPQFEQVFSFSKPKDE